MPDREKVIKGLENCLHYKGHCLDCPYNSPNCQNDVLNDALALLQEQKAEPLSHMTDDSDLYFTCGKCGHIIWSESYKFCPMCATQIAWNGEGM